MTPPTSGTENPVTFLIVRDAAGLTQVVVTDPAVRAAVEELTEETVIAPVALRHPTRSAALRISAAAVAGFRAALDARDFVEIHTPKVVGASTESGANVFALDWFGRPAYLAQSPQPTPTRHGRRTPTVSTCSSGAWSW